MYFTNILTYFKDSYMATQDTLHVDKYTALENTLNWIENSSAEEFMAGFNSLTGDYGGVTIAEVIADFESDE